MILLRRTRRRFRDGFKAKIALEALRGDQTLSQIAARHKASQPDKSVAV